MKINADNLHCLPDKQHKDCDWYYPEEMECTNWGGNLWKIVYLHMLNVMLQLEAFLKRRSGENYD